MPSPRTPRVTVLDIERALVYRGGRFETVLDPGQHWVRSKGHQIIKMDMRPDVFRLVQAVTTSENRPCNLTCVIRVRVSDPRLATESFQNYKTEAFTKLESVVKKAAGTTRLDELRLHANVFAEQLKTFAGPALAECGCVCLDAELLQVDAPVDPTEPRWHQH